MNRRDRNALDFKGPFRTVLSLSVAMSVLLAFSPALQGATSGTAKRQRPRRFLELKLFPTPKPENKAKPKPKPTPKPTPKPPAKPKPKPAPKPTPAKTDPAKKAEQERLRREREAQKLFDLAVEYIKRGRRDRAKTYLRRLAREYPRTELAPHALVQLAEIEDNLDQADNILARVILDYPNTEWAEVAWYKRGEVNMLLWDYAVALQMFEQYLKRNPRSSRAPAIRRQMAVCQLKLGQAEKALETLKKLREDYPQAARQPETLETLAECHIVLGHSDRALSPLETVIKKHPTYGNFTRTFLLYALCLEDLNRFDEAKRAYGQLVEQFPRSSEARLAKTRLADLGRPLLDVASADRATSATPKRTAPTTGTLSPPDQRQK